MAVVVNDATTCLELEADILIAEWSQAHAHRFCGVDLGIPQRRQEFDASLEHLAHRLVIVQADVQVPLDRALPVRPGRACPRPAAR